MTMPGSVLVTGGSGFIGSHLVRRLRAQKRSVTVLDLVEPRVPVEGVRYVRGDVRNLDAVTAALDDCTEVWHLAAAHHDFGLVESTYFSVNQGGTSVLLSALERAGISRLCFFSSVAVYGSGALEEGAVDGCSPEAPYGMSKLAAERIVARWCTADPLRAALVIRPAVVYGPGHTANVYALLEQIERGRYVNVGKGQNIKSLAFVDNLLDATEYAWQRLERGMFEVYNYSDTPHLTSREIADALHAGLGRRAPLWSIPMGLMQLLCLPFDVTIRLTGRNLPISSARVRKLFFQETHFPAERIRSLGFRQKVGATEGLRQMAAWYQSEGRTIGPVAYRPPVEAVPFVSDARGTNR